jgi:hypothetical protein
MEHKYYSKIGKNLSGSAFHSFSALKSKYLSLEKPLRLGNFYHTINLKAKTSVMKRVVQEDVLITVWEE